MSVEQRSGAGRRVAPAAAPQPPFHLRIPDVYAEQVPVAPAARTVVPAPPRDPIVEARAILNEKRILEGHRQVTSLIAGARDQRRKFFGRLWAASILLTALSVVALAVELVQRMDFLNSMGDTMQIDEQKTTASPRGKPRGAPVAEPGPKSGAPREWSNQLPAEGPNPGTVQSAGYEAARTGREKAAWLSGTISDNEHDSPRSGDHHDDHQSRAD
jgi:hypothetical protein